MPKIVSVIDEFEDQDIEGMYVVPQDRYEGIIEDYPNAFNGCTVFVVDETFKKPAVAAVPFTDEEKIKLGWIKKGKVSNKNGVTDDVQLEYKDTKKITAQNVVDVIVSKAIYSDNREEIVAQMRMRRDQLLNYIMGYGNPADAFTCLLDQDDKKRNVYRFDEKIINEFTNKLSDESIDAYAENYYRSNFASKDFLTAFAKEFPAADCSDHKGRSIADIYAQRSEDIVPGKTAVATLAAKLRALSERHESRSFWFKLLHPIENFREWNMIRQGKNILINRLGVPSDLRMEMPNPDLVAGDEVTYVNKRLDEASVYDVNPYMHDKDLDEKHMDWDPSIYQMRYPEGEKTGGTYVNKPLDESGVSDINPYTVDDKEPVNLDQLADTAPSTLETDINEDLSYDEDKIVEEQVKQ